MTSTEAATLIARLQTVRERLGNPHAVALFVTGDDEQATGRVQFSARFPVRREVGARPVTVYSEAGEIVPSRLVESKLVGDDALPEGRVWWSLVLEFAATDLDPNEPSPYLALYAESPESRSEDVAFWESLPILSLTVTEFDTMSLNTSS